MDRTARPSYLERDLRALVKKSIGAIMFNEDILFKLAANFLGVSTDKAREHFRTLQDWNIKAIQSFDSRLRQLETNHAEVNAKLDELINLLRVNNEPLLLEKAENGNVHSIADQRFGNGTND